MTPTTLRRDYHALLSVIALSRGLPPPRDLRVLRRLGEELAAARPFDRTLSFALDRVHQLLEEEVAA